MRGLIVALMIGSPQGYPPYEWLAYCASQGGTSCQLGRPLTVEDVAWVHAGIGDAMTPDPTRKGQWIAFPADKRGDCSHYAMSYRSALIALGADPARVSLEIGWVGEVSDATAHIVVVVDLGEAGVWVMDQLAAGIYRPTARPYAWTLQARQISSQVAWQTAPQANQETN